MLMYKDSSGQALHKYYDIYLTKLDFLSPQLLSLRKSRSPTQHNTRLLKEANGYFPYQQTLMYNYNPQQPPLPTINSDVAHRQLKKKPKQKARCQSLPIICPETHSP